MEFPKIHKLNINDFSLYKRKNQINLQLEDGVFCLAGANGLGKSTFISIFSFAMLGIVIDPSKNFSSINSIPKFFKSNEKFAQSYFNGRVEESKRDISNVYLEFEVNNFLYKLNRKFFDISELNLFSRVDLSTGEETIDQEKTSFELEKAYNSFLAQDVGLQSFDQFAFIHSFILTFDESKKLLFWDESLMNRILLLFFGIDPENAEKADDLRKNLARHESNMRNLQWNITQNTRALGKLHSENKKVADDDTIKILENLRSLEDEISELYKESHKKKLEIRDAELNIANISLSISNEKKNYSSIFSEIYNDLSIEKDEKIIFLLREIARKIIEGADIQDDFKSLKERAVEVSQMMAKNKNETANISELKKIDLIIKDLTLSLNEYELKNSRVNKEYSDLLTSISEKSNDLESLKTENEKILLLSLANSTDDIDQRISSLESVINKDISQKEIDTRLRDECKRELNIIEKEIKRNYADTQDKFLPIFKQYATSFIGLDIDVELKSSSNGLSLVLKVNNTERTDKFQLSESQQYFIDIALRFALIEFTGTSNSYIVIDTPEGSLDIAYESRAGRMFGDFVLKGFDIIMTANINSSQLLLQLAKKCKNEKMKIERMTDWTILSEVQQSEQEIIEEAFNKIEEALV